DWSHSGIITARYVIYLPAGILSAVALLSQRPILKAMGLNSAARDCVGGAAALGLKGVASGLIVSSASFFPASVLNYSWFVETVGLPVAVFRALAAVFITYFILRVMHHFEVRRQQEREYVSYQLKRLSIQVLTAQEEERKRIARELHDDTAQLLSSLLLRIKLMDRAKSLEEVRARSPQIVNLAVQAAEGVRRMARELRPPALEDLGLAAAINWYSEELALARGLSVEVRGSGFGDRLPTQLELGLYRVVQEALTNVAKHSGASSAVVTMERMSGAMRVLIEDCGCGFDVNQITNSRERGLGLFGMRERISLLGGTLNIVSQPEHGTRITLEVPITEKSVGEYYEN
ncbi:MAG: sensor histidine kinase, partial [Dehalococcoidia bacterium]|nr:sensor histidine kinase [Dehalococcoidia bacterium]